MKNLIPEKPPHFDSAYVAPVRDTTRTSTTEEILWEHVVVDGKIWKLETNDHFCKTCVANDPELKTLKTPRGRSAYYEGYGVNHHHKELVGEPTLAMITALLFDAHAQIDELKNRLDNLKISY